MKGFIAIILFFVLALAGVKTGHLSVASSIAVPGQCAVQDDCFTHSHSVNEGAIIPLERERYLADMEFSDAYTLAHRVSTSAERLYRFSSIETTQYIKALLRNWPHVWTCLLIVQNVFMILRAAKVGMMLASIISLA